MMLSGDTIMLFSDLLASSCGQFFSCSVLVHSGGVHGGHYYAFIRPTLSDQWYACFVESPFVRFNCNIMDYHACSSIQDLCFYF
jgi:uncharacterized UBP type Zn finger protein